MVIIVYNYLFHSKLTVEIGDSWRRTVGEVLNAIRYERYHLQNPLSYMEKLKAKYDDDVEMAVETGVIESTSSWLEAFLKKNRIYVDRFLMFIHR